jgi:hypothetical protein
VLRESGHLPTLEKPMHCAALIGDFLQDEVRHSH